MIRRFLGPSRFGIATVSVRGSGLSFVVRSKMDIWSIKESVVDRCYEVHGFPIDPNWTIFDIGAAIGDFSIRAAQHPTNRVIAFEPFPESFDLLTRNIELNNCSNVVAIPSAVASRTGTLELDLSSGEPLHLETAVDIAPAPDHQTVESISLKDAIDRYTDGAVDLLKLDCEGAEYDILGEASPETLTKIERIVMEYHERGKEQNHQVLAITLERAGYSVQHVASPVHPTHIGYL